MDPYQLVEAVEVHVGVGVGGHLVLLGGLLALLRDLILRAREAAVRVELALAVELVFFQVRHYLVHEILARLEQRETLEHENKTDIRFSDSVVEN